MDLGFEAGFLSCANDCTFDTSACCEEILPEICNGRDDDCDGVVDRQCGAHGQCAELYGEMTCRCDAGYRWDETQNACVPISLQSIRAGYDSVCALDSDSTLYCWGYLPWKHGKWFEPHTTATDILNEAGGESFNYFVYTNGHLVVKGNYPQNTHDGRLYINNNFTFGTRIMSDRMWINVWAGKDHVCALSLDHNLWCWGNNDHGQVGPSQHDVIDSTTGAIHLQLSEPVATAMLGRYHSCAITSSGHVWCWGEGAQGQLGDGSGTSSATPVQVLSTETFVSGCAGQRHTCALTDTGKLYCWGDNQFGQVTVPQGSIFITPRQVTPSETFTSVTCGSNHTCAVKSDGSLWCWGDNRQGQIGTGTTTLYEAPTQPDATASITWSQVSAANDYTCALDSTGMVYCWGDNTYYTVPMPPRIIRPRPITAMGSDIVDYDFIHYVYNNQETSGGCAIHRNGDLYCWGKNIYGELGVGDTTPHYSPEFVGVGWSHIAFGYSGAICGIKRDGTLWCWGRNQKLPLGEAYSSVDHFTIPQQVGDATDWKDLRMMDIGGCAMNDASELYCWGNYLGNAGIGTTDPVYEPTLVPFPAGVTAWRMFDTGINMVCAIGNDGEAYCWGRNEWYQCGNSTSGSSQTTPYKITRPAGVNSWLDIAPAWYATCGLGDDHVVYCWGSGGNSAIMTTGNHADPRPEPINTAYGNILSIATALSGGLLAVTDSGYLIAYGGVSSYVTPMVIRDPHAEQTTTIVLRSIPGYGFSTLQVKSGTSATACILRAGTPYCWGRQWDGQLPGEGHWTDTPVTSPRPIQGIVYAPVHPY